jgi:hypothetical protein
MQMKTSVPAHAILQEAVMYGRAFVGLSAAAAIALAAPDAPAQIRGSELGSVMQVIDGTRIVVEYSRPAARGRTLFGTTVPWNQPWTGANWATTLEVDKPVRLNGTDVAAGKYSVWLVPQQERWTVVLDPDHKLFHFQKPDSTAEQIRIAAAPEQREHVEMLTWSFPAVSGDGATLRMQWGTTALPLQVVVQPSRSVALAPDVRSRYIGSYALTIPEGLGWPTKGQLDVFERNGMLRGRMNFPVHPGDELEFDLIPSGQDRLSAGLYRDGKLFNVEMGGAFEFDVDGERATKVRMRGIEGSVFFEGTRTP